MKLKNIKEKVILAMLLLSLMILFGSTVCASENTLEIPLRVKQIFDVQNMVSDTLNQTGTYELTASSQDSPMPEHSENGTYMFSINGASNDVVIPLTYVHGGVYEYKLWQTTTDGKNYSYDRTSYTITVYIKNGEAGQLIPEVIVKNGTGKKCGESSFQNSYTGKRTLDKQSNYPVKTGDQINRFSWIVLGISALVVFTLAYLKRTRDIIGSKK